MAQDQFINVTVDIGAAKRTDITDHRHQTTNGAAASGDLTLSWDSTKFTNINLLRSATNAVILKAMGQMK